MGLASTITGANILRDLVRPLVPDGYDVSMGMPAPANPTSEVRVVDRGGVGAGYVEGRSDPDTVTTRARVIVRDVDDAGTQWWAQMMAASLYSAAAAVQGETRSVRELLLPVIGQPPVEVRSVIRDVIVPSRGQRPPELRDARAGAVQADFECFVTYRLPRVTPLTPAMHWQVPQPGLTLQAQQVQTTVVHAGRFHVAGRVQRPAAVPVQIQADDAFGSGVQGTFDPPQAPGVTWRDLRAATRTTGSGFQVWDSQSRRSGAMWPGGPRLLSATIIARGVVRIELASGAVDRDGRALIVRNAGTGAVLVLPMPQGVSAATPFNVPGVAGTDLFGAPTQADWAAVDTLPPFRFRTVPGPSVPPEDPRFRLVWEAVIGALTLQTELNFNDDRKHADIRHLQVSAGAGGTVRQTLRIVTTEKAVNGVLTPLEAHEAYTLRPAVTGAIIHGEGSDAAALPDTGARAFDPAYGAAYG